MPTHPSHCDQCGTELRHENMKAGTNTCYTCYTQRAAIQSQLTAIQSTEYVAVTPKPAPREDPMERLAKLKEMVEAGLITVEEYNTKKAEILAKK
jgi:protein-arginine kinase activator protein McsA